MEKEHAKQVLRTIFNFIYCTCYSRSDTEGSQEFISNFHLNTGTVQMSNDCAFLM